MEAPLATLTVLQNQNSLFFPDVHPESMSIL